MESVEEAKFCSTRDSVKGLGKNRVLFRIKGGVIFSWLFIVFLYTKWQNLWPECLSVQWWCRVYSSLNNLGKLLTNFWDFYTIYVLKKKKKKKLW